MASTWEITKYIKEARERHVTDFSYLDEDGEKVEVHMEDMSDYPFTETDYF